MKQKQGLKERMKAGDVVLLRVLGHPVTVNEVHAVIIGVVTGAITGGMYAVGMVEPAIGMALTLVGYAVIGRPIGHSMDHDDPEYKNIGIKTIKHEPWWFLGPYLLALIVAGGVI